MSVKDFPKKYVNVFMTERFIELQSYRAHSVTPAETIIDAKVLPIDVPNEVLGQMLVTALAESRFLSEKESDEVASTWLSRYQAWAEERMHTFGYQDRYEFFQHMNSCFISSFDNKIVMRPQYHIELARWTHEAGHSITTLVFADTTSFAQLGAGLRLTFRHCDSKKHFDWGELLFEIDPLNRLKFEVVDDAPVNYAYLCVCFDKKFQNFMEIRINDDRKLVFLLYQSYKAIQLSLTEWDQMQLQAEMFLVDTLRNEDAAQQNKRRYKESE